MTKTNLAPMLQPKKFQWQKFLLVCFLGIATGIFLGSWYSYTMLTANVDYSIYSEEKLREDESYKDIISSVLKISNRGRLWLGRNQSHSTCRWHRGRMPCRIRSRLCQRCHLCRSRKDGSHC